MINRKNFINQSMCFKKYNIDSPSSIVSKYAKEWYSLVSKQKQAERKSMVDPELYNKKLSELFHLKYMKNPDPFGYTH